MVAWCWAADEMMYQIWNKNCRWAIAGGGEAGGRHGGLVRTD